MEPTSTEAYHLLEFEGVLSELRLLVVNTMKQLSREPRTAGEIYAIIAQAGGKTPQIDSVRNRFAELEEMDIVRSPGTRCCKITGLNAKTWELTGNRLPKPRPVKTPLRVQLRWALEELHAMWKELQAARAELAELRKKTSSCTCKGSGQ